MGVGAEISGTYGKVEGKVQTGRPVYARRGFRIAFNGVAWTITKQTTAGSGDSAKGMDAILAFVQDMAPEPYTVINEWHVARTLRAERADRVHEGFVVDP